MIQLENNKITDSFEIKKVQPNDYPKISGIFEACFGEKVDERYFKWKYLDNPAGRLEAHMALSGNDVAAFYGLIPEIYWVNGKKIKSFQSMDTMTHPKFQKKGLFVRLAEETFSQLEESQKELFLIGVPGGQSYHGFVKRLKWKHAKSIPLIFQLGFVLRLPFFSHTRNTKIAHVHKNDLELKRYFLERERSDKPVQLDYSLEYFSWRVFDNIHKKYFVLAAKSGDEITGIVVYSLDEKNRAFISFLDTKKRDELANLGKKLIAAVAKYSGASWVYTWEPSDKNLKKSYGRFLRNPLSRGPFSHKVQLILRANSPAVGLDWTHAENFDLQPLNKD